MEVGEKVRESKKDKFMVTRIMGSEKNNICKKVILHPYYMRYLYSLAKLKAQWPIDLMPTAPHTISTGAMTQSQYSKHITTSTTNLNLNKNVFIVAHI